MSRHRCVGRGLSVVDVPPEIGRTVMVAFEVGAALPAHGPLDGGVERRHVLLWIGVRSDDDCAGGTGFERAWGARQCSVPPWA